MQEKIILDWIIAFSNTGVTVIANLMIQLTVRNAISASSWQFILLNLGLTAILGITVLVLMPRLDPERVMLSAG